MKFYLKIVFLFGLICLLTACGFQLRSAKQLPPELTYLNIKTSKPYGNFTNLLVKNFRGSGLRVSINQQSAAINLNILQTSLNQSTPTIGTSNQARVYGYTYIVNFNLTTAKNKILLATQTVSGSGNLILNSNQVLGGNNQLNLLKQQLQQSVVNQIYNRLSSEDSHQALAKLKS